MSEQKESVNIRLALLREPFPNHQISLLPKPKSKDAAKGNCSECGGYHGLPAVHLKYVGHAALTDRLLDVDPTWEWEPLALDEFGLPRFDKNGGLWIKLTVCGKTRMGYGNAESSDYKDIGSREKEVIGDALRNAAMRFGAALDLWHKGDLHGADASASQESPQITGNPYAAKNHQPGPEDGDPNRVYGYSIPFGKYAKRTLEEIPAKDLENYALWLESNAEKKNQPLGPAQIEFIERVGEHLKAIS